MLNCLVSIGGRAGGQKYKCAGILFKFVVDPGMYCGTLNAMKSAGITNPI